MCESNSEEVDITIDSIDFDEPFVMEDFDLLSDVANDDTRELYPSCKLTILKSLALLFSWFCSSPGTSKESFSHLFYLLNTRILPCGNFLPASYNDAIRVIKCFIVPVKKYDSCINDCVVFRKHNNDLSECPSCHEPRYEAQTKIARKVFKYIPLGPRLSRMFKHEKISKDLQSHMALNGTVSTIADIHQSKAWKDRYQVSGPFNGDSRGICLSLCADGMNPFSKEKVTYSMWPIVLTVLNLPRAIRNLPGSMLLAGIIPGKDEPKILDPYLDILVDELIEINDSTFFDGYKKEHFQLKIDIMLHVLDYPGQNKVFHCHGKHISWYM